MARNIMINKAEKIVKIFARRFLPAGSLLCLVACATTTTSGQSNIASRVTDGFNESLNSPNPCASDNRNIGLVVGTAFGAGIGYLAGGTKGAVIGAVKGFEGGYLTGQSEDYQRCALYRIAIANEISIASAAVTARQMGYTGTQPVSQAVGLDVRVLDEHDEFIPGTAVLTPNAQIYMAQIGRRYTPQELTAGLPVNASEQERDAAMNRVIFITVHILVPDQANAPPTVELAQARAQAVGQIFESQGVRAENIYYQGVDDAGQVPPSSDTAAAGSVNTYQTIEIMDMPSTNRLAAYLNQDSAGASQLSSTDALSTGNGKASVAVDSETGGLSLMQSGNAAGSPDNPQDVFNLATGELMADSAASTE